MNVVNVNLRDLGVAFPAAEIGVVVSSPLLKLTSEPFKNTAGTVTARIAEIQGTLRIAVSCPHKQAKTHFTIFPECSIPGPLGIRAVEEILASAEWPNGTVVIGGIDALRRDEYIEIVSDGTTAHDATINNADNIAADEWINCAVTWVKTASGELRRWVQPKLTRAWPEVDLSYTRMYQGNGVFHFEAKFDNDAPCSFFSLICFDWIGSKDSVRVWRRVLREINAEQVKRAANAALSWIFVLQHNESPCHQTFMAEASALFTDVNEAPSVSRQNCCLVLANTAGCEDQGVAAKFGFNSIVYSRAAMFMKGANPPTYSNAGSKLRKTNALAQCADLVFRENGACTHSFSQRVPNFIVPDTSGRTLPIENASVHPRPEQAPNPRAPGAPVPASIKWLNDFLDSDIGLERNHQNHTLQQDAQRAHNRNKEDLRGLTGDRAYSCIASSTCVSKEKSVDEWGTPQIEGAVAASLTLNILRVAFPDAQIPPGPGHAFVEVANQPVDVIAVRGTTHVDCIAHAQNQIDASNKYLLVISRDQDNMPWNARFGKFTQGKTKISGAPKFTDVNARTVIISQQELLVAYSHSADADGLRRSLDSLVS